MSKFCIPYSLAIVSSAVLLLGAGAHAAPPIVEPPVLINSLQAPPLPAASAPAPQSKPPATGFALPADLTLPAPPVITTEALKPGAPLLDKQVCAPVAAIPAKKVINKNSPLPQKVETPDKVVAAEAKPLVDRGPFSGLSLTQVSDTQLNQFIFPEPVEGLYFPEGSPLPECPKNAQPQDPCKPIFLNGKKLLLLPMRVGAKGPVQMLAHLNSGRIVSFNLAPVTGPGTLVRVENADYAASDSRTTKLRHSAGQVDASSLPDADVSLLGRFVQGDIPTGYEPISIAAPTRLAQFDLIPTATWSDGNQMRVHMIQIRPFKGDTVTVNAGMFKGDGVKAVALDKDTASAISPATVFILEAEVSK